MDKIYSRYRIRFPRIKNEVNKKSKKTYFVIMLLIIMLLTSYILMKSIAPIFDRLCISKAHNIATEITNKKTSEVLEKYNYQEVVQTTPSDDGSNRILKTDVVLLNKIISEIATEVQKELHELERQNIEIPIGALTGNKYLTAIGPKMKIQLLSTGEIETEIKTEFESAGINQTIYRIYMELKCNVAIVTAYKTIEEHVINQVLLVETVIVGGVPETYLNVKK